MQATKRKYESPALIESGAVAEETRLSIDGTAEPNNFGRQMLVGDIGFGL